MLDFVGDPYGTRTRVLALRCFSAGAALLVVGAITVRHVRVRAELPFALIPALFGVQQLLEGVLWLTFPGKAPQLSIMLTHVYSLFSHVLWPIYVPIAVLLLEPIRWRRRLLTALAIAGAAAGLYLLYFLVTEPIVAQVTEGHIAYISPHFYVGAVLTMYVLATCASALVSSRSMVRWFGVATAVSLIAASAAYAAWFISVWCFFAAVMSVTVLLHFVRRDRGAERTFEASGAPAGRGTSA